MSSRLGKLCLPVVNEESRQYGRQYGVELLELPPGLGKILPTLSGLRGGFDIRSCYRTLIFPFHDGAAAGQTVFHYHVHLIPRSAGDELRLHSRVRAEDAELLRTAKLLASRCH